MSSSRLRSAAAPDFAERLVRHGPSAESHIVQWFSLGCFDSRRDDVPLDAWLLSEKEGLVRIRARRAVAKFAQMRADPEFEGATRGPCGIQKFVACAARMPH